MIFLYIYVGFALIVWRPVGRILAAKAGRRSETAASYVIGVGLAVLWPLFALALLRKTFVVSAVGVKR